MKKKILCPRCGRRLIDTESTVKSEIKDMDSKCETLYDRWVPDYYVKCWKCKAHIGIRKIG